MSTLKYTLLGLLITAGFIGGVMGIVLSAAYVFGPKHTAIGIIGLAVLGTGYMIGEIMRMVHSNESR